MYFSPTVYKGNLWERLGLKRKPIKLDPYTDADEKLLFDTKVEYSPDKAPCYIRPPRRTYLDSRPSPSAS
jgi:hypothetical protein